MEEVNSFIIQNITKNITKYIIISLFTIYVIMEIITISKFSFDYNYNYNYGKKLKHVCNNKNIEFETNRFQLYNNILNNVLQNTTNSSYNYIIFLSIILTFAIIFGLLITYILYNYINDIIILNNNDSDKFKMFCYLMMIIICGFCLIILPLYIGYNFDKNNQLNLDIFDRYVKYGEYLIGILIAIMIIVNMNTYNFIYKTKYNYGNNFVITMSILFYLCLYLTKSVISFYKKKINKINYKNEDIKSYYDLINNFLKNELDTKSNIFNEYLLKLFNIDYNNIDLNFYTSILIISLILIIILMIFNRTKTLEEYLKGTIDYNKLIECLLYNDNLCNNFLFKPEETKIIYNFIVLPIVFIILITITINSTINYNEIINKNLILHPLIIYKTEIDNVNNKFSNILHNDKFSYKEQKSVDRNIANTILLVLYNEIFSDMLLLTTTTPETISQKRTDEWKVTQEGVTPEAIKAMNDIYLKEEIDKIKENKEKYKINILPKFKYVLNNKKEILDYNKLDEYNIDNYLVNECGNDIFITNNLNSKCNETNRFILFYLIRSVFLYEPIADMDGAKKNKENYIFYSLILKYKIYKSLEYYKNEKNYLGNAILNDNNYEKNCTLNIKYEHPKITKEELLILLSKLMTTLKQMPGLDKYEKIFKDNINTNETKENIYQQIQKLIANKEYSDLKDNIGIINTYIDLDINKSNAHIELLNDRIDKIKFNNNLIKIYEITIDSIIDHFINYITEVQIAYFMEFRENTNVNKMNITLSDLNDIFKGEQITENNKQKINNFIIKYKKIIKRNFNEINNVLSSNHEIKENEYHKQNNVTNYLLNNYNLSNNNRVKTYIEKINKDSYKNSTVIDNQIEVENENINEKIKIFMDSIIISFYYNHYFILEIKNKYSEQYLNNLINSVKSLYDNNDDNKKYKELKKEYIIKINELIIILKYTLDNTISNGNTNKILDYIKKSSVNKYIIDELIKFDENNSEKKLILNNNINNIKDFVKNTDDIKNFIENKDNSRKNFSFDLITNDYVNNIRGINNKIKFFVSYIEELEIKSSKYNEKNIEFINNMLMEQMNLLEIISNTDVNKLNFNDVLEKIKYLDKFDNIITDYNNYYKKFYNIKLKNLIKEESEYKSTYTNNSNKENANIIYKNANIASNMVLLLLSIYIIILYLLIKIK